MIIDVRNHAMKISQPSKYLSKLDIEQRVDKVLTYMKMEIAARKVSLGKIMD
ncbi:hypothetical protein [Fulvivirga ligni]|uniref:hypothetical protein n=1 Tax=Fulvivirga ligni TaxID=2904246 RepID=UPI001F39A8B0|nr:hypothetical protein [Fulvivirga ligni]UII19959.1 hypothetical protein LVD16_19125 [Fulvivirga ligni]